MGELKSVDELFEGRHFDREVIILCVRWYLRFKLSLRDLVEMMAERGLSIAHTTIMRWVLRYAPEFEKRWQRFARAVGRSWRVDETYVKIRGEWCYLYRAVDRAGRTVDFRLSTRRDVAAAKAFFRKAVKGQQRAPQTITLDCYAASHRPARELKADGRLPAQRNFRRPTCRRSQYGGEYDRRVRKFVTAGSYNFTDQLAMMAMLILASKGRSRARSQSGSRDCELYTEGVHELPHGLVAELRSRCERLVQAFPTEAGILCNLCHASSFGDLPERSDENFG